MCNKSFIGNNRCDGELCDSASQCKGNRCEGWIKTCKTVDPGEALAGGIIAAIIIGVIIFCCCLPCIIFFCCIRPRNKENGAKEVRKAMESSNQSQMQMNQQM